MLNETSKRIPFKSFLVPIAAIAFFLTVFVPLGTYLNNAQEFIGTSLWTVVGLSILVFAGMCIVLGGLFALLRPLGLACRIVLVCLSAVVIAFYVQGNLINLNYGVLDGHSIPWNTMVGKGIINTLVWVGIVSAFLWFIFGRLRLSLQLIMSCFGAYLVMISVLRVASFHSEAFVPATFTEKNLTQFSSERNVLVFVIDTFDQNLFDELIEKKPELVKYLSDFTYYHNTIGKFPTTKGAMPHILTGIPDDNSMPFSQYKDAAYLNSPIYVSAATNGYTADVYCGSMMAPSLPVLRKLPLIENVGEPLEGVDDRLNKYVDVFNCSIFTYLPHFLKRYHECLYLPKTVRSCDVKTGEKMLNSMVSSVEVEKDFYSAVDNDKIGLSKGKALKFYLFWGVHNPDYNLSKAETVIVNLGRFFEKLRARGIWDKCSVLILADHGCSGKERPIFLCNNITGPMRISEDPFSYDSLTSVYELAMRDRHIEVPVSKANRSFWFYSWDNSWDSAYLPKIEKKFYDLRGKLVNAEGPVCKSRYENQDLNFLLVRNLAVDGNCRSSWFWTLSDKASLEVPLVDTSRGTNITVALRTAALLSERNKDQRVRFYINDRNCGDVTYKYPSENIKEVRLPVQAEFNTNDCLKMRFEIDHPVKPADLFPGNGDGRLLGIRIDSIAVCSGILTDMIAFSDLGDNHIVSAFGFAQPEIPYGRWSDGIHALMSLALPSDMKGKKVGMNLSYHLFLPEGKIAAQRVRVEADGVKLIDDRFSKPGVQEMKLKLTPEMTKGGVVELKFTLPDAASPSELGVGNDPRKLAIFLRSCKMEIAE